MRINLRVAVVVSAVAAVLSLVAPAAPAALLPAPPPSGFATEHLPTNLARFSAMSMAFVRGGAKPMHRALQRTLRASPLADFVSVGPVHRHRFTVTAISDQVCLVKRPGRRTRIDDGACRVADLHASGTPLQDSARLLNLAAKDSWKHDNNRGRVLRELLEIPSFRFVARLVAPQSVHVAGLVDGDRDGYDDDARVEFHARGSVVCASLPLRAGSTGRVAFGGCSELPARRVHVPRQRPRQVFRAIVPEADYAASLQPGHPLRQARQAARYVNRYAILPGSHATAIEDRVQLRVRVNGGAAFACYRVSPEGRRARYSRSGAPGTWRLGHCG